MSDQLKTWPERIYLQHGDEPEIPAFNDIYGGQDGVTWCIDKINDADVEYVRAGLPAVRQDDALIAQQAREIAELKERLSRRDEDARRIYAELYCIGGPLNDNKLGYTKEQIEPFRRIANLVED